MKYFVTLCIALVIGVLGFISLVPSEPTPGAVSGPVSSFPCETHNGSETCFNRIPLTVASTTVCAIKSPTATSTLTKWGGISMRVSSTTASVITMAKSLTPYATTTLIGSQIAVAANAQAHIVASTTAAQDAAGVNVFAPNTWFVISLTGGVGTFSPVGTCHADFSVL